MLVDTSIGWSCVRCGNCCTVPLVVELNLEEFFRLSAIQKLPRLLFQRGDNFVPCMIHHFYKTKSRPGCVFYNNGCSIYEQRPAVCRLFPFSIQNKNLNIDIRTSGISRTRCFSIEEINEIHEKISEKQFAMWKTFMSAANLFKTQSVETNFIKHTSVPGVWIHREDYEEFFGET